MYSASSPGPSPMWYCRSPAGIAIRRSEGFSTRWSAFGKTSSSLTWLLRWRETRPRIVPRSHERQAEWIVLGPRSAERGADGPRRGRRRARRTAHEGGQTDRAIRAASRRRDCARRRSVTATDATEIATSVPMPGGPGVERQRCRAEAGEPAGDGAEVPGTRRSGGTRRGPGVASGAPDAAARRDRRPGRCRPGRPRRRPRRPAAASTRPDRVERVVGLDEGEPLERGAAQDDPADRGAVVEREAVGARGRRRGRRPGRAVRRAQSRSTRSASMAGSRGRAGRGGAGRRAPSPEPAAGRRRSPVSATARRRRTSAGNRGVTANRWSAALG